MSIYADVFATLHIDDDDDDMAHIGHNRVFLDGIITTYRHVWFLRQEQKEKGIKERRKTRKEGQCSDNSVPVAREDPAAPPLKAQVERGPVLGPLETY